MPAEVAACAARRKPAAGTPAEAAAFARQVVAGCGPLPAARPGQEPAAGGGQARRLEHRRGAGACAGRAVAPVGHRAVHRALAGPAGAARLTLRTNLRFIARQVVPHLDPADAPLPRGRAKKPYSAAEIAGYLALADAQPTAGRRARAAALVCLGAGAGLIRSDLRNARGTDVCCRSGGVIVKVGGRAPRAVPVLARYHQRLLEAATFAGEQLLTGGAGPGRGNITNPLTRSLAGGGGLPPLDTSRLRATWLAECAVLIGLPAFMHAAGITCCQRLGDIIAGLDPPGERHAVTLLGGRAR